MPAERAGWTVLLIGGPSGVGKTTLAERLGKRYGAAWLQVDDLRLALQHSHVVLPSKVETEALYFFLRTPSIWQLPAERLRDALIAVGEAMLPAVEIVVAHHVETQAPVVIEGDGIVPSLLDQPRVRDRVAAGQVRAVFLVERDEEALFTSMVARGRWIANRSDAELRVEARAKWLHGRWLTNEAHRAGLPVLAPRPWTTLVDRVVAGLER